MFTPCVEYRPPVLMPISDLTPIQEISPNAPSPIVAVRRWVDIDSARALLSYIEATPACKSHHILFEPRVLHSTLMGADRFNDYHRQMGSPSTEQLIRDIPTIYRPVEATIEKFALFGSPKRPQLVAVLGSTTLHNEGIGIELSADYHEVPLRKPKGKPIPHISVGKFKYPKVSEKFKDNLLGIINTSCKARGKTVTLLAVGEKNA